MWDLCTGEHAPADMEAALRQGFRVGPQHDVAADVQRVLVNLEEPPPYEPECRDQLTRPDRPPGARQHP